jgi:1,2-diacylglycerol 3-beta-glucosyltransferase
MRSRIILLALIFGVWVGLKALDEFVTGPEVLTLLAVACVLMLGHSIWLLIAQGHWQLKTRRHARRRLAQEALASQMNVQLLDEKSSWTPFVDIFISAKNESRVIEKTVRNFFAIDYENFYLWIIDDCSTDSMGAILDTLKGEFPRLQVLHRTPGCCPGKSAALNEALPLAKGEVIAVFDADAYVAPDFFAVTLPVLEPEGIGAVQAQKKIYEHQSGLLVECQSSEYALDTYFQMGRDLIGGAVELRGNGQVLKRAALIDVGGWNNKSITDDLDLSMRLLVSNWDIRFCPNAYVFEEAVPTLKGLIRQRRRWAEGSIIRYLDYIFPLNSPTRLSLVERIDTLVFTVYFVVPALILCEIVSECVHLVMGIPTNGKLFGLLSIAVLLITQMNMIVAIRMYRPQLGLYKTILHSFEVNAYLFGHWVPVVIVSFCQILFGRKTSTWHPTQHGQEA